MAACGEAREGCAVIKYGTARWTIWTPAAWGRGLPADRYVVIAEADGKEATSPLSARLGTLRALAAATAPLSIAIRSAPGDDVRDLLELERLKHWRDLAAAPGVH